MKIKTCDEINFIISVIAPPSSPLKKELYLSNTKINSLDFNLVYHILIAHNIAPFFYDEMNRLPNITACLPSSIIERLEKIYYYTCARNILIDRETHSIAKLFSDNRIPVIILKGTELVKMLYSNIGVKIINDIDMLVKKNDIKKCFDILCKYDFVSKQKVIPQGKYYDYRHHFGFLNTQKKLYVELHWNIAQHNLFGCVEEDVWMENVPLQESNSFIRILTIEYTFILLLIQLMRDKFKSLKNLIDFSWFIEKFFYQMNIDTIIKYLIKYKLMGACFFSLELVSRYFAIKMPLTLMENLQRKRFHIGQRLAFKYYIKYHFNNLKNYHKFQWFFLVIMRDSMSDILRCFRREYFPAVDFMKGELQIDSHSAVVFGYIRYYLSILKFIFKKS